MSALDLGGDQAGVREATGVWYGQGLGPRAGGLNGLHAWPPERREEVASAGRPADCEVFVGEPEESGSRERRAVASDAAESGFWAERLSGVLEQGPPLEV